MNYIENLKLAWGLRDSVSKNANKNLHSINKSQTSKINTGSLKKSAAPITISAFNDQAITENLGILIPKHPNIFYFSIFSNCYELENLQLNSGILFTCLLSNKSASLMKLPNLPNEVTPDNSQAQPFKCWVYRHESTKIIVNFL